MPGRSRASEDSFAALGALHDRVLADELLRG